MAVKPAAWLAIAGVAAVAVATTDVVAGAPSRIVDRTFVCSPRAYGGVGDLDVWVTPRTDYQNGYVLSAHLLIRTGGFNPADNLVFVRARPQPKAGGWLAGAANARPGVYAQSKRCTSARASVRLASKGIAGPPTVWNKELDCAVRGRLLVRVRAELEAPAEWRRADRWFDGAWKNVTAASLAVRNQRSGAPLVFMQLDKAGKTRLWFSPSCR